MPVTSEKAWRSRCCDNLKIMCCAGVSRRATQQEEQRMHCIIPNISPHCIRSHNLSQALKQAHITFNLQTLLSYQLIIYNSCNQSIKQIHTITMINRQALLIVLAAAAATQNADAFMSPSSHSIAATHRHQQSSTRVFEFQNAAEELQDTQIELRFALIFALRPVASW